MKLTSVFHLFFYFRKYLFSRSLRIEIQYSSWWDNFCISENWMWRFIETLKGCNLMTIDILSGMEWNGQWTDNWYIVLCYHNLRLIGSCWVSECASFSYMWQNSHVTCHEQEQMSQVLNSEILWSTLIREWNWISLVFYISL